MSANSEEVLYECADCHTQFSILYHPEVVEQGYCPVCKKITDWLSGRAEEMAKHNKLKNRSSAKPSKKKETVHILPYWKRKFFEVMCSECFFPIDEKDINRFAYCPGCGRKMKK